MRFADVNLDEDEDMESNDDKSESDAEEENEDEEGEDDEFIDLLDVLDGKGDIDMGSEDEITSKSKSSGSNSRDILSHNYNDLEQDSEDSGLSDEEEEEEEDEGESSQDEQKILECPDDEEVPEALDRLKDYVSNLDVTVKKRKAPEANSDTIALAETRARKRRFTKERTEAGAENEFRAHSTSTYLLLF